jgi:hypothetical protein
MRVVSRRGFLVTAAVVSAAVAGTYVARPHLRKLILPELDTAFPVGKLNGDEMGTILALGEVLAAPQFVPEGDFFRDHVDETTQTKPGLLKEYRRAAALLNAKSSDLLGGGAPRRFVDLVRQDRDKVLEALLSHYSGDDQIMPKLEKLTSSRNALALRVFVVGPLLAHYYRSRYGWAVVGYRRFPSVRRRQVDYTFPLSGEGTAS